MLITKFVSEDEELVQIAALSLENSPSMVPDELKEKEGYVTWNYPIEDLRVLHQISPSIIVKDGDKVVAYVVILLQESEEVYKPLKDLLDLLRSITYQGKSVFDYKIYMLGQDCVHRDYRGKGVIKLLFDFQKEHFASRFELGLSAISVHNPLSQKVHERLGAQTIYVLPVESDTWNIVAWDWRVL
ncbi:GNAT family N-acetyltransferase [Pedobacter hartonius]|uniref:N-acetyltransferase domain-containing protein n=1 Tax=Pedobacter hartonius TaxID=425514 RepID=A0A1H4EJN6_9SPHI|nr:GNAT family N-acetyltransferase [Pedobacter hartonius]SEA85156.1 hypothetical protein SAMN05443550_1067 [Pedobacter hartonius]